MSLVRGRINRARGIQLRQQLLQPVAQELQKGRLTELAPHPVAIEPPYWPLRNADDLSNVGAQSPWNPLPGGEPTELRRFRIWIAPDQGIRWDLAESFARQLQGVRHRVAFEMAGNCLELGIFLACHAEDVPVIRIAFESAFPHCALRPLARFPLDRLPGSAWEEAKILDFVAPAVYSKPHTQPAELPLPPLAAVIRALSAFPAPAMGLYQVLFQPVAASHNWHRNIATLHDYEFFSRLLANMYPILHSTHQAPSGDGRILANAITERAPNDKPFFATSLRLAVVGGGPSASQMLRAMDVFSGLLQHGTRPLHRLGRDAYQFLTAGQLGDLFRLGLTYRPGILMNSAELTSLLHLPPAELLAQGAFKINLLEKLVPTIDLSTGSAIGICEAAGEIFPICIPLADRVRNVHVIGKPGCGKSELLKRLIIDDIRRGDGCVVMDPHGDLVDDLLDLIPPDQMDRIVLLDWSDPEWIPILNPLADVSPAFRGKLADNIMSAFKDISEGFADRAGHIMRSLLHGLLYLRDVSLLDASDVLSTKTEASQILVRQVLDVVDDPLLKRFWRSDLGLYKMNDLTPVAHKLGLLLDIPPVSRTFMQTQSKINFRKIIEERKILIINLSGLSTPIQSTIGSLILSLLQIETLDRSKIHRSQRLPFHFHIDEAYLFSTDALDDLLVQCRKYGIGVSLCHQYLRQYTPAQVDALATVGTTVIFNVDDVDAQRLCNGLQKKVEADDIIAMKPWEAIVRINTEIVHIKTEQIKPPDHVSSRQAIINASHQRYYKPAAEVMREVNLRNRRWEQPFTPLTPAGDSSQPVQELVYDEFA